MGLNKTLKFIFMGLVMICVIIGIYKMCRIRTLTHLSEQDLEWISCYEPDDTIFFSNCDHQIDTMIVTKKSIHNSTSPFKNPFLKLETGSDYLAYACMFFRLHHCGIIYDSNLFIYKDSMDLSPFLSWRLGNFINNEKIPTFHYDCVVGDSGNSHYSSNFYISNDSANYIETFEWCKKIGLKTYNFKNSESYEIINR